MQTLKNMWASASDPVRIALVVVGGIIIIAGFVVGVDWSGLLR